MKKAPVTLPDIENRRVPIEALAPHPRNYRIHPEKQLGRLAASLARFGQVRSVVAQEGAGGRYLIVAGHGLVEAAKRQHLTELRADIIPAHWTPEQVEGYLAADNLLSETAEDDEEALAELLEEQKNAGYSLESLGYSEDEYQQLIERMTQEVLEAESDHNAPDLGPTLFDSDGEEDDDERPKSDGSLLALIDVTIADPRHQVQRKEVYTVGPHILICADVIKEWAAWSPYLYGDKVLFCPYPGPFIPLTLKAQDYKMVMVQPDPYIAGHVLDRYSEVNGEDTVSLLEIIGDAQD